MAESKPRCKNLVLDAGPLLSLSPLRGLAEIYLTVPQVLNELKDKRAREHFERLGLSAGVQVDVRNPDAASLAHGQHRSLFCWLLTHPLLSSGTICEEDGRLRCLVPCRYMRLGVNPLASCERAGVVSG
jgi:hypothetical protein